jgi:tetratricopeptide (TPR) repeat protein
LAELRDAIAIEDDISAQAKLLGAIHNAIYFLADPQGAETEFALAHQILNRATDICDRLRAQSAYTFLAWVTRNTELFPAILKQLDRLLVESQELGVLNASLSRIHRMHGCLLVAMGDYEHAISSFGTAHELAKKHGDLFREAASADNISLCHGRMGNYGEQIAWGEKAIRDLPADCDRWILARGTLRIASALSMSGDSSRGLQRLNSVPSSWWQADRAWVEQAGGLLRADVLMMSGEAQQADNLALETLRSTGLEPLSQAYAGTVARWTARIGILVEREAETRDFLKRVTSDVARYDAFDQVEIVSARLWYETQKGGEWVRGRHLLVEGLKRLPAAVGLQLRRLQVLT